MKLQNQNKERELMEWQNKLNSEKEQIEQHKKNKGRKRKRVVRTAKRNTKI